MSNPAIRPDRLEDAEKILLDAGNAIRRASKEHGHTYRSFTMIAEMWTTYMKHAFTIRGNTNLQAHDVAQMMSFVKKARATYGQSGDNFVDDTGYTALAAMLTPNQVQEADTEQPREPEHREPEERRVPRSVVHATPIPDNRYYPRER